MPRELIFTSVPSGISPGSTGYCTVAKHKGIDRLLDQAVEDGEYFDFFGVPAKTATSAAKIAIKLNALVVPSYAIRSKKTDKIKIYFEDPIPNSNYRNMTAMITKSIETRVSNNPEQWYWLHRRWKY